MRNAFERLVSVATLSGAWLSCLLGFCVLAGPTAAQNKCPTVKEVGGSWEPKIRNGEEVCVGTVLNAKKDASITIEFKDKNTIVKKTCMVESGCKIPVLDPGESAVEQNIVNRIFAVFTRKRLSLENGAVMAVSRGLEPGLEDCVVSLNGTQVELSPAFKEMKPGKYWVRLESLPKSGQSLGPFEIQWAAGSASVTGTGLKTGLHELTLVEKTGEPAGSEAWILITRADDYRKESSRFQDAVQLFQKWADESDPVAIRIILRAYLESFGDTKPTVQTP